MINSWKVAETIAVDGTDVTKHGPVPDQKVHGFTDRAKSYSENEIVQQDIEANLDVEIVEELESFELSDNAAKANNPTRTKRAASLKSNSAVSNDEMDNNSNSPIAGNKRRKFAKRMNLANKNNMYESRQKQSSKKSINRPSRKKVRERSMTYKNHLRRKKRYPRQNSNNDSPEMSLADNQDDYEEYDMAIDKHDDYDEYADTNNYDSADYEYEEDTASERKLVNKRGTRRRRPGVKQKVIDPVEYEDEYEYEDDYQYNDYVQEQTHKKSSDKRHKRVRYEFCHITIELVY